MTSISAHSGQKCITQLRICTEIFQKHRAPRIGLFYGVASSYLSPSTNAYNNGFSFLPIIHLSSFQLFQMVKEKKSTTQFKKVREPEFRLRYYGYVYVVIVSFHL